jgi:hypothetical protein
MGILLAPAGAEFIELALQVGHEYALAPGKERWNNETDLLPASGWSITEDVFRTWVPEIVPQAPAGKAGNWLATVPGKGYFVILSLYGPTKAAFDKSWKPGNRPPARNIYGIHRFPTHKEVSFCLVDLSVLSFHFRRTL